MATFDTGILDKPWRYFSDEKTVLLINSIISIKLGKTPRDFVSWVYSNDQALSIAKITSECSFEIEANNVKSKLIDNNYWILILDLLSNQIYYRIYADNKLKLYHCSEAPTARKMIDENKVIIVKEYRDAGLLNSRCLLFTTETFTLNSLNLNLFMPAGVNCVGQKIPKTLRMLLHEVDEVVSDSKQSICVYDRVLLSILRNQVFYKTNGRVYHESELPMIKPILLNTNRTYYIKNISIIIYNIHIITLLPVFGKWLFKSMYEKNVSSDNM